MPLCKQQCDKTPMVRRLCVHDPQVLQSDRWQEHLRVCTRCGDEYSALERSLALFKTLEADRLSQLQDKPDWDLFKTRLRSKTKTERRLRRYRLPSAAAIAAMLILGGVMSWPALNGVDESPGQAHRMGADTTEPVANVASNADPAMETIDPLAGTYDAGQITNPNPVALVNRSISSATYNRRVMTVGNRLRAPATFRWVDLRQYSDADLIPPQFMRRRSEQFESTLLAPLTPLRTPVIMPVNITSYDRNSRH